MAFRQTTCPMCGWTRNVVRKRPPQKVFRYGTVDMDPNRFAILKWAKSLGHPRDGRKGGFETVGTMTFKQAYADPRTRETVIDVMSRCVTILRTIKQAISEVEMEVQ